MRVEVGANKYISTLLSFFSVKTFDASDIDNLF